MIRRKVTLMEGSMSAVINKRGYPVIYSEKLSCGIRVDSGIPESVKVNTPTYGYASVEGEVLIIAVKKAGLTMEEAAKQLVRGLEDAGGMLLRKYNLQSTKIVPTDEGMVVKFSFLGSNQNRSANGSSMEGEASGDLARIIRYMK
jgi:hypothetical protein